MASDLEQRSSRLAVVLAVLIPVSGLVLVIGAAAVGGGHGSYILWWSGLALAGLSSLLAVWCFVVRQRVVFRKRRVDGLSLGVTLALIAVLFFWISGWWR